MQERLIQGLAHIGVYVKNLEKSKKFYCEILDFTIEEECSAGDSSVAFAVNGDMALELIQPLHERERADGVVDHIALKVTDIEKVKARLEERGLAFKEETEVTFAPEVYPNGSRWIMFRGPDNEHLELNERL